MAMPKPTPHWINLQQRTEEEIRLLQWKHIMCMQDGNRKHTSHVSMFSLVKSLHLGPWMTFYSSINVLNNRKV